MSDNKEIKNIMADLEKKGNPKTVAEGIVKLNKVIKTNNPEILLEPIKKGAKEFEERVGRPMTYSEMRSLYG